MYDYDRRNATVDLKEVLDKPLKADASLISAARDLLDFKQGIDKLQVIPPGITKAYDLAVTAINLLSDVRKETYDLRLMVKRLAKN